MNSSNKQGFGWERDMTEKWKALKDEDITEMQPDESQKKIERKNQIDEFNSAVKRKSLIRYLVVIIDFSSAARKIEYRPNRAIVIKTYLSIDKMNKFMDFEGNASLHYSLEIASESFMTVPHYAKKEIVVIFSSITNCDRGNIAETMDKLREREIQCNVISLSAQIYVLEKLTQVTQGEFLLAKDQSHFKDLLKRCLIPKEGQQLQDRQAYEVVKMGFPKKEVAATFKICNCHSEIRTIVYTCPNCTSSQCESSSFCKVCGIMLVSAVHLSRTTQHNNTLLNYQPIKVFLSIKEQSEANSSSVKKRKDSLDMSWDRDKLGLIITANQMKNLPSQLLNNKELYFCNGCEKGLYFNTENPELVVCPGCSKIYCIDCDIFIHETLLSCPTCQLPKPLRNEMKNGHNGDKIQSRNGMAVMNHDSGLEQIELQKAKTFVESNIYLPLNQSQDSPEMVQSKYFNLNDEPKTQTNIQNAGLTTLQFNQRQSNFKHEHRKMSHQLGGSRSDKKPLSSKVYEAEFKHQTTIKSHNKDGLTGQSLRKKNTLKTTENLSTNDYNENQQYQSTDNSFLQYQNTPQITKVGTKYSSIHYNKNMMYSVKGNKFINKQGPRRIETSGLFSNYGTTINDPDPVSLSQKRSVIYTATKPELIQDSEQFSPNTRAGQTITSSKYSQQKPYFNVNSSHVKFFNPTVYQDMTPSRSRNQLLQLNKSVGNPKSKTTYESQSSLLMNLLNLKPKHIESPQKQDNFHPLPTENYEDSPLKTYYYPSIDQKEKMDNTLGSFFIRRQQNNKLTTETKKIISDLRESRNTIGKPLTIENQTFYSQVRRKDYRDQEQKQLICQLGLNNKFYMASNQGMSDQVSSNGLLNQQSVNTFQLSAQSDTTRQYQQPPVKETKEEREKRIMEEKLRELRSRNDSMMSQKKPLITVETPDIALYKERGDTYKVLSNRIKTRAQVSQRKFLDRNVKILEKFYDPLRIKLRVMPLSRAPLIQGKNSDYYFIEAAKLSLKGDLPIALEQLKRGLELKSNHLLCRFNHGVLQFKLGLLQEATSDFEMINQIYGIREPTAVYNLAICYAQSGKYQESLKLCTTLIDCLSNSNQSGQIDPVSILRNKELVLDAYRVKGICCYRVCDILEAIRCYNTTHKLEKDLDELKQEYQQQTEPTTQQLEYIYINLILEETRHIFEDVKFQKAMLKQSRSHRDLNKVVIDMHQFKRFNSQKQLDFGLVHEPEKKTRSPRPVNVMRESQKKVESQDDQIHLKLPIGKKGSIEAGNQRQDVSPNKTIASQKDQSPSKRDKATNSQRFGDSTKSPKRSINKRNSPKGKISQKDSKSLSKFSGNNQQTQNKFNLLEKLMKTSDINEDDRKFYDSLYHEIQEQSFDFFSEPSNDLIIGYVLERNDLKVREVLGTKNQSALANMIGEQDKIKQNLKELAFKFNQKQEEWQKEFEEEERRLQHRLFPSDEEELSEEEDWNESFEKRKKDLVIEKLNKSLISADTTPEDIRNIIIRDQEDKKRKEAERKFAKQNTVKRLTLRQIEIVKHEFNKNLELNEGEEPKPKNLAIIDRILKVLKYFKRFDQDVRNKIYNHAEYLSLDAQTTIFRQGDEGDKLFIILKGRVSVQVNSKEYGNLPVVVATLDDGDQFGELSLIKLTKLHDSSKQGEIQSVDLHAKPEYARRKATCIVRSFTITIQTVEQTDLLALPKDITMQLYQPEAMPKKRISKMMNRKKGGKISAADVNAKNQEEMDELNKKIQFLQQIPIFEEVDATLLMPIACNMIPHTYSFGEFIIKEGDVPQGLYLIKSGQCKVASRRISDRVLASGETTNKKLGEKKKVDEKHPLFQQYDPDNSLLNEVKSLDRAFQNDRIYVGDKGEQVRNKIQYQDILVFSQLMPKNCFGGRVLLPFEMYMTMSRIFHGDEYLERWYPKSVTAEEQQAETEDHYQLKSLLSVIADSGSVEVYILKKSDMSLIPDFILRKVFEKIAGIKEPDRPYTWQKIEIVKEALIKWERFKVHCIDKMFKEKYMKEKSNGFR